MRALPILENARFAEASLKNLSVLAYFFWNDERIDTEFDAIRFAFLNTFQNIGIARSILVVNRTTTKIEEFCERYGIEIQIDATLNNGLASLNIDCLTKLHTRFDTEYVLIIQNDGFPLRSGIERFVGSFDYVGAPWIKHLSYFDLFPYPKYAVGNGGFSLRSKRLCQAIASAYAVLKYIPIRWFRVEDIFYGKVARCLVPGWNDRFMYAAAKDAAEFSHEWDAGFDPDSPPIGFHSRRGFSDYVRKWGCGN